MKNSEHSSAKQSKLPSWLIWSIIILSFLGFLDASYLTINHYTGFDIGCGITGGCEDVLNSKYATLPFIGIPMAVMGLLYYLVLLIASLLYYDTRNEKLLIVIPAVVGLGFLFTFWLIYLQKFVLESWCQYCLLSAIITTSLFILSLFVLKYRKV